MINVQSSSGSVLSVLLRRPSILFRCSSTFKRRFSRDSNLSLLDIGLCGGLPPVLCTIVNLILSISGSDIITRRWQLKAEILDMSYIKSTNSSSGPEISKPACVLTVIHFITGAFSNPALSHVWLTGPFITTSIPEPICDTEPVFPNPGLPFTLFTMSPNFITNTSNSNYVALLRELYDYCTSPLVGQNNE
jgi:hypothetical protein